MLNPEISFHHQCKTRTFSRSTRRENTLRIAWQSPWHPPSPSCRQRTLLTIAVLLPPFNGASNHRRHSLDLSQTPLPPPPPPSPPPPPALGSGRRSCRKGPRTTLRHYRIPFAQVLPGGRRGRGGGLRRPPKPGVDGGLPQQEGTNGSRPQVLSLLSFRAPPAVGISPCLLRGIVPRSCSRAPAKLCLNYGSTIAAERGAPQCKRKRNERQK